MAAVAGPLVKLVAGKLGVPADDAFIAGATTLAALPGAGHRRRLHSGDELALGSGAWEGEGFKQFEAGPDFSTGNSTLPLAALPPLGADASASTAPVATAHPAAPSEPVVASGAGAVHEGAAGGWLRLTLVAAHANPLAAASAVPASLRCAAHMLPCRCRTFNTPRNLQQPSPPPSLVPSVCSKAKLAGELEALGLALAAEPTAVPFKVRPRLPIGAAIL